MADRYDERYRGEDYRRNRGYGRDYGHDDRGFLERAGDEVRSWFGDDEAERRRRVDEARYGRDWDRYGRDPDRYGREWDYGHRMGFDYGRGRERGLGEERWGGGHGDTARIDYWRPGWPSQWNEPRGERLRPPSGSAWGTQYGSGAHRDYNDAGRFAQGPFSGRGPRGYQRSDERIREDVCDRLADDPWIDASDVEVAVRGGEVTLSGMVRDRDDKRRAEDLIESLSGVREVHNNLRVPSGREGAMTPGREGPMAREQGTPGPGAPMAGTAQRR